MRNLIIEGKYVRLEEVAPKYFEYIIRWRNDAEVNKYLNQPYELTLELQQQWYSEYVKDCTQGLIVLIDKVTDEPFGTLGWTDHNEEEKSIILGRLLIGNVEYRGSLQWIEAALLANDYFYTEMKIKNAYSHVMINNIASIKWHLKWGYSINKNFKFKNELFANGVEQIEFVRKDEDYHKIRETIGNLIY